MPFRVYGDGADASQHFELFTILPLLCCSRSTLDNRSVTAIRNTNKTTSECRRQILVVLAWSFEALRNLIKYHIILSNQSSLKLGVCLVISHLHSKRYYIILSNQPSLKLGVCLVISHLHSKRYYIILSNQPSLKLGVCLVISHLHSKRPEGTQEEVKLNIIDWNLFQLPSILCKVVGYIHIKIHGANHFQRYTTQSDLQWLGAG